ncbi:uncharacterized protein LOC143265948 [Megachile rotundata]|uniref:uncharacterized protein LOC143265948 n=1 Tax=Megachile rotundata TaxID=143995 RepID=UPI003FD1A697
MKKLLLVILLSATSIDAKDTLSGGDVERQVWWKRKRKDEKGSEIFFSPFSESMQSSALSTLIRYLDMNRSQDPRKSKAKEYLRYRIPNSIPHFGKFWKSDKSYLTSCDSRKECYREGWEIQKPLYVDEPSWIKIDDDQSKTRSIHRLDVTDPFVISRGKKVHGEVENGNIYADRKLKFENEKVDGDDESKRQSNMTENSELKHGVENEVGSNKFHPLRSGENSMLDENDWVLFFDWKDKNFADIFDVRNRFGVNRCLVEPCYTSDKMDERQNGYRFEKPKSKRISSSDAIGRSVAKDVLERLIENLECDSIQCADSARTMKRTRLADGRGILEHLLTKSDPFYVARGKRVSRFPVTDDL